MTTFINCTPHAISVISNEGVTTIFDPSGIIPRVGMTPGVSETIGHDIGGFTINRNVKGEIEGLPERCEGVYLIVSGMVLEPALAAGRDDCVGPNTGSTAIRNDKGHIVAVRGFV